MKIRALLGSDLHLEFVNHPSPPIPDPSEFDIVLLPGDISMGTQGIRWAKKKFPNHEILYVPGNHEHYRSDYWQLRDEFDKLSDSQIHILNPGVFQFKNTMFIGATLWSNLEYDGFPSNPNLERFVERSISDFGLIRDSKWEELPSMPMNSKAFTVERMKLIYAEEKKFIEDQILKEVSENEIPLKIVVMTHFLPSAQCTAAEFLNSQLNPYFASDCDNTMIDNPIAVWCFGHTHSPMDFIHNPSGTRLICNPFGYPEENEDPQWKIIEI